MKAVKRSRQNNTRDNSTERELRSFRPLDYRTACALAAFADERGGDLRRFDGKMYQGTIADHFLYSSSLGRKARILYNVVRRARPERCLEIGTAWGMSTMIIAEAQRNLGLEPQVITIEPNEPQYSTAQEMLSRRYAGRVSCVRGKSDEALPSLADAIANTGFVFDDGAHRGDMYLGNFQRYRDHLLPRDDPDRRHPMGRRGQSLEDRVSLQAHLPSGLDGGGPARPRRLRDGDRHGNGGGRRRLTTLSLAISLLAFRMDEFCEIEMSLLPFMRRTSTCRLTGTSDLWQSIAQAATSRR